MDFLSIVVGLNTVSESLIDCHYQRINFFYNFSFFLLRIEDFIDYNEVIPDPKEKPVCDSEFLFSMNSYDHLRGVSDRKNLVNSSEYGLVNPIPQAKDLSEFGHRIKRALSKVTFLTNIHGSLPW